MANAERLKQVLAHIEQHPEEWDQSRWHCGSSHCFCGTAQILAGYLPDRGKLVAQVREWLDLSQHEFRLLSSTTNTLTDLHRHVDDLIASRCDRRYIVQRVSSSDDDLDGFDRYGFNRYGFDRDGYDYDGLDINNKPRPAAVAG